MVKVDDFFGRKEEFYLKIQIPALLDFESLVFSIFWWSLLKCKYSWKTKHPETLAHMDILSLLDIVEPHTFTYAHARTRARTHTHTHTHTVNDKEDVLD